MNGPRPIVVCLLGGTATGLWSAQQLDSPWPLLGLLITAAAVAVTVGGGLAVAAVASTVALSSVAGRSFGYAGTGLTEVDEIMVPLLPALLALVWLTAVGDTTSTRQRLRDSLREHWPLWGLVGWATATALWADRPGIALMVASAWGVMLAATSLAGTSPFQLSLGAASGLWAVMVAGNVREWASPVLRPFGGDGSVLLPVDKIVGFGEDSTELADFAVAGLFLSLLIPHRVGRIFGVVLSLLTIARTDQRGAIVATVAGCVVLLLASRSARTRRLGGSFVPLAAAGLVIALAAGWVDTSSVARADDSSDLRTLSNRTQLWSDAWDQRDDWLLAGSGPGAEEMVVGLDDPTLVVNVHNRLLQLGVTLGAVGMALTLAAAATVWRSYRRLPTPIVAAAAALVVSGMSVPGFGAVGPTPATITLAIAVWAAGSAGLAQRPRHAAETVPPRDPTTARRAVTAEEVAP